MDYYERDDGLKDLLVDFEVALREHLKSSDEFQSLVEYPTKKHGTISLYVAAQIMGAHIGMGRKTKKRVKKAELPLGFELTKKDENFLRSLKISTDV